MYSNIKLGKLPEMPEPIKKTGKSKTVKNKAQLYKGTYKNKLKRKIKNV